MRPVMAEFRRAWAPARRHWIAIALLFAAAVVVWGGAVLEWHRAREARIQLANLRAAAERQASAGAPVVVPPWEASAREMLAQANSPWPAVLKALETVRGDGITVAAVSINVPSKVASVEVQFGDYQALLAYIEALNLADKTLRWGLVQAQADGRAPSAIRYRATIRADLPSP